MLVVLASIFAKPFMAEVIDMTVVNVLGGGQEAKDGREL